MFDPRRRKFISLLGGAAAWPRAARAQQPERMRRIGLQQLGWTSGNNVRIDFRFGAGDAERNRRYASELVAFAPDVIVATGSPVVEPLRQMTRSVPIIFLQITDPVGAGLVASLARPGGNMTGFTNYEYGMSGKWLELLKEVAPRLARLLVLREAGSVSGIGQLAAIQALAPSLGVEFRPADVRDAREIERDLSEFVRGTHGERGLIVTASGLAIVHRQLIVTLAARHILPASVALLCPRWGSDRIRSRYDRPLSARRGLRRQNTERREARRLAGAGTDQV
jgi:putative tryptophan/tyrosine transport system substrate-binding protein